MRRLITFLLAMTVASVFVQISEAREFTFLAGGVENGHEVKPVIRLQYSLDVSEFNEKTSLIGSLSWLRELNIEKPEKHHRDGPTMQIGLMHKFHEDFSAGLMLGGYAYYDTQASSQIFGVAPIATVMARYPTSEAVFLEAQFNAVFGTSNNTRSLMVGIGLDLDKLESKEKKVQVLSNDIALYANSAVVEVQYRRNLGWDNLGLSVGYVHRFDEGPYGFHTQLRLYDRFFGNRVEAGIGAGPFVDLRAKSETVTGAVSIDAAYYLTSHMGIGVNWTRIVHVKEKGIQAFGDEDVTVVGLVISF